MGVVKYSAEQQRKAVEEMQKKISNLSGEEKESAIETLRFAIKHQEKSKAEWMLEACKPKYGPMNPLLNAFYENTDIPLEIPFFCAFHLISGLLLKNGSTINGPTGEISPELWTIVLAPSGAGKTISHSIISKTAPVQSNFPECASSASFFEALLKSQESQGFALWFQDEFAQILKQIETTNSPLSETKSYLLRAYSNEKIERSTKRGGDLIIQKPKLGILALNTDQSFVNAISAESMLDGFAQRFGVVIAPEDDSRHITDFPLYNRPDLDDAGQKFWDEISQVQLCDEYVLSPEAINLYTAQFKRLYRDDVSKSFFRRIMFRAFKYSVIYHILLGKSDSKIDAEDMSYSISLIDLHLDNMAEFISMKEGIGAFVESGKKTKSWMVDIAKRQGVSKAKARDLQSKDKRVFATADTANFMLDLLDW